MLHRISLILLCISGLLTSAEATEWTLVWADEFEVDGRPNAANWNYEQGFVRNNELQWYQPENAFCENGYLVIEGRRERQPNPEYNPDSKKLKHRRELIIRLLRYERKACTIGCMDALRSVQRSLLKMGYGRRSGSWGSISLGHQMVKST